MDDLLRAALLITAAQAQRLGIGNPTGTDFTVQEIAEAREGLEDAEELLYGDEDREDEFRISNHDMDRDQRLDDQHRGAVPREWKR